MVVVKLYALVVEVFSLGSGVYFSPPRNSLIVESYKCESARPPPNGPQRLLRHSFYDYRGVKGSIQRPCFMYPSGGKLCCFQSRLNGPTPPFFEPSPSTRPSLALNPERQG
jgi:hypothetical protein